MQFLKVSRLKAPSRVDITSIELQSSAAPCVDGSTWQPMDTAVSEPDIFASSTLNFSINLVHMEMLKNNAFVGNTGHFDKEIDDSLPRSTWPA